MSGTFFDELTSVGIKCSFPGILLSAVLGNMITWYVWLFDIFAYKYPQEPIQLIQLRRFQRST